VTDWKQKLRKEIELYKNNIIALSNFDKNAFLQEYNTLRKELDKEIVSITSDYYEIMCECYTNYCAASSDNLNAIVQKNDASPDLKELKNNYKALLAAGEKANDEIKEINKKNKEIKAEIKTLNESINKSGIFGSLHNTVFGDYKKKRIAELENFVIKNKNRISELKKVILSDEEKAIYEADIKAAESAKRRINKKANTTKTEMEYNEKSIRTEYSQLIGEIERIYENYIEKLRALKTYKEYSNLLNKIDLTLSSAYITEHYVRLAQIAYICSGGIFKASLPEKFSAPCREIFDDINRYISADRQEELAKRAEWTSCKIEQLYNAPQITNDGILQVFGMDKKEPQTSVNVNSNPDFARAMALLQKVDTISVSMIQKTLGVGYSQAARIIDELEEAGFVGPYNGSKPRVVIRDAIGVSKELSNSKGKSVLPDYIFNTLEAKLNSDRIFRARKYLELKNNDIIGLSLNSDFILQLESVLDNTDGELPEIAMALVKDDFEKQDTYHSMLLKFKDMYYATPDQVAIANQEYYAQKEIEQIRENARLEREMYERQAELDRIAENERNRQLAAAERERAYAIERQTSEMARQSELDRNAANLRSQQEISARNAIAERQRKDMESAQKAYGRCNACKRRSNCVNFGAPNCAMFVPK